MLAPLLNIDNCRKGVWNMSKIIGIDLGTTNSLVSVWEEGHAQLIPNSFGEYLTPSVVSMEKDGTFYVGKVAKERMVTHPQDTASVFKRFMGTSKTYWLAGREYRPEELSALVLKKLKEDAENYLGEPVEEAVISVPAYFNDMARNATKNAGKLAGLKVERIINEPSAAALACQQQNGEEDVLMLVFDFGGGTLDVSLVDCFENIIEILAVSGDNHLGGSDFDEIIAREFCRENNLNWEEMNGEKKAVILESAIQTKVILTEQEEYNMQIGAEEIQGSMTLSRKKLIQISEDLFARMSLPIQRVLADGKVTVAELQKIVLVGGSCKMPVVQKYLEHLLGTKEIHTVNPDYMIALGVGVYAGIKERNKEVRDMLLTDICPFSLGTGVHNYSDEKNPLSSIVIERNTALPASREISLYTVQDNQTRMEIKVYQGEEMYAKNNILLGELNVKVPSAPKGKERVRLRYTYDINGILVVDATVVSTDAHKQLVIVNKENILSQDEIQNRMKALEKLKIHPREKEENQLLLARGEKLYKETVGDMRESIDGRIKYFSYLLEKQDEIKIKRWYRQLSSYLDGVEEYLQSIRQPWENVDGFARWYAENSEENSEENKEEQQEYEYWKGTYYTS